jgi:hypothetical protein
MMVKKLSFLMVLIFMFSFVTVAHAETNKLTAVKVTKGKYVGYQALKGYQDQTIYQIYFKGDDSSRQITVDRIKKINMNEVIKWKYKGKTIKSKRSDLYKFFSDTAHYSSRYGITDDRILTQPWFQKTFGKVYLDWVDDGVYLSDADSLVNQYFSDNDPNKVDRFELSN